MDDIKELWNSTSEHNWSALHKNLQERKGKAEGISDKLVDMMMMETKQLENSGTPYPKSENELYDILNQRMQQTDEDQDEM